MEGGGSQVHNWNEGLFWESKNLGGRGANEDQIPELKGVKKSGLVKTFDEA